MSQAHFGTVTIVGVGLIGASLGLALKKAGCVTAVLGVGRSQANLDQALKMGAIDTVVSIAGNVNHNELVDAIKGIKFNE